MSASLNDLSPEAIERHIAQNPQLLGSTIELLRALAAPREGWKLVPIEPTQEMIDAGNLQMPLQGRHWFNHEGHHYTPHAFRDPQFISCAGPYRAMTAAAPNAKGC